MLKKMTAALLACLLIIGVTVLPASAAAFTPDIETVCKSVYLLNLDTDNVVYEKNADAKMYPASTTKIMTYIITAENISDIKNTKVVIEKEILDRLIGTDSSMSGLENFVGRSATVYDLLKCLMIKSGNDAALILANFVGDGSIQTFVDMMNKKAKELGCINTHFMNPHGLHDEQHYTTARDLATITKYAQTLPEFNEISDMVSTYISIDTEKEYPLITTNKLIDEKRGEDYYYEFAKGIKTGTTDEAGYCLVSTAVNSGYTYMCIALGAPSVNEHGDEITVNRAMKDTAALYKWAFANLRLKSVLDEHTPICEIPIELAWNQDTVQLVPQGGFSTILPSDVESTSIDISTKIPNTLKAPVIEGSVIGTATISYANQELTTVNLIAAETVERSKILFFLDSAKKIIRSQWMIFSIIIVAVLIMLYMIITLIYNKKKSNNRKMKNKKRRRSSKR